MAALLTLAMLSSAAALAQGRPAQAAAGTARATSALKALLESADKNDEWPLDTALKKLADGLGPVTSFEFKGEDGVQDMSAPPGASAQEWAAVRAALTPSALEAFHSENGGFNGELRDLDGRGVRSLVLSTYVGGTGLFSETTFWTRAASGPPRFVLLPDGGYSINGRGSNQDAQFARIGGRIYLVYRDSDYDVDRVGLLRPAIAAKQGGPSLELSYAHTLSVLPAEPAPAGTNAAEAVAQQHWRAGHAGLLRAIDRKLAELARIERGRAKRGRLPRDRLCTGTGEPLRGAGHYTYDAVTDFSVRTGGECHEVTLVSFRSSYLTSHTSAVLWVTRLQPDGETGEQVAELPLQVKRSLRQVRLSRTPVRPLHGEK
ncbi:MAG: hypothetical protein EOO54_18210 [Haliea sp.]|nr:MAG: hypothetical protein EOO54_18210 [Haliea sp.]